MGWTVYILYNTSAGKIYIGQTNNIERRLIEHNRKSGNHYTSKFSGLWELLYKEVFNTRKEAILRERQLKSYKGRQFIKKLINSNVH